MKRFFILFTLSFAMASLSVAQSVEISPMIGYNFADKFNVDGGTARISDGMSYGGSITIIPQGFNSIELTYRRMDGTMTANSVYLSKSFEEPVSTNYVFISGNRMAPLSKSVMFTGGLNLGVGFITSKNDVFSTVTKFAMGLNAGIKYFVNDKAGIRVQANLDFPVTSIGATFGWSSSGGAYAGAGGYVPFWQFGFSGGLVYKLR